MRKKLFFMGVVFFVIGTIATRAQSSQVRAELNLNIKDISRFVAKKSNLNETEFLVLKGKNEGVDWQNFSSVLEKMSKLKGIELIGNELDEMPAGFGKLKQLQSLCLKDNHYIELSTVVTELRNLELLKKLEFEITEIKDLPTNINEMKFLKELSLIQLNHPLNAELMEEEDEELTETKLEFIMPLAMFDGSRTDLKVSYTGLYPEEMRDEMNFFASFFPGTYSPTDKTMAFNGSPVLVSNLKYIKENLFEKNWVNVKPPSKDITIEKNVYAFNATKGGTIMTNSGSSIRFPVNAFVDAAGNPITSEVIIDYREFKDPIDFMLSGIPMTYDSGGVKNDFKSAGMFELNASAGGKEVFLAPGKTASMEFTSTDKANTYNFYSFNDKTGNWDNIGKPGNAKVVPAVPYVIYSEAWKHYCRIFKDVRRYDTLTFDQRFKDKEYEYVWGKWEQERRKAMYERKRYTQSFRLLRINGVSKNKDGEIKFKLKSFSKFHPEMAVFANNRWMLQDAEVAKNFRSYLASCKYASDIRLEYHSGTYTFHLKTKEGIKTFSAVPVVQDEKKKWVEMKDGGAKLYKRYAQKYKMRRKSYNRQLNSLREYKRDGEVTAMKVFKRFAFKQVHRDMSAVEKKMTEAEWIAYAEVLRKNEQKILDAEQAGRTNITRSLELSGFGIYNCDQIARMQQPMYVRADYKADKSQKLVDPETIYVISKGQNSVFRYGSNKFLDCSTQRFATDKAFPTSVISFLPGGNIAITTDDEFKSSVDEPGNVKVFKLNTTETKGMTVEELKKKAGF